MLLLGCLSPILSAASLVLGCAGVSATSTTPRSPASAIVIGVSPQTASVLLGNSTVFLSTLTNTSDPSVWWSVNGIPGGDASVGTISATGVYVAPTIVMPQVTVQVSATSRSDIKKSASATVSVLSDVTVAVRPNPAILVAGTDQPFSASIASAGRPNTSVVWSLHGQGCATGCGTIDAFGNYTAPPTPPIPAAFAVEAQSVADPSKQSYVPVKITAFSTPQPPTPPTTFPLDTIYDVKKYGGALCDGLTDDTAAIQKTINDAGTAMSSAGGAGVIYFPPSSGPCVAHTLTWPTMVHQGWLVSEFDNTLQADALILGGNNAYRGRTSNFLGISGSFLIGPTAEWIQTKSFKGIFVDISGISQVWIQGLDIQGRGWSGLPTVHLHDRAGVGAIFVTIKDSVIGSENGIAFVADSSAANITSGFGLYIENGSFSSPTTPTMAFTNFGLVTIRGRYINHGLSITNAGIASNGDFLIDDVLSESLTNGDFLTMYPTNGSIADITLNRVTMADSQNSWLVKQVSPNNQLTNVKIEMIPLGNMGKGLVDPASSPALLSVFCEGYGCAQVLEQAQPSLYLFFGFPPRSPALFFGSKYVHNPLKITWE